MNQPLVSVCIIALNEEDNLPTLLNNVIEQDFSHEKIEIVLVDSGSKDKTKDIMFSFREKYKDEFCNIIVTDNYKKIQASGWNTAIKISTGELIIRVDAHALIPSNFVTENVKCIESGESVCGGKRVNVIDGEERKKIILLAAENSLFGSGIAKYRQSQKREYVKTVAHACYKREVFKKVGLFNETLLRSEDNEMHYRIIQNGYKICLDSSIYSEYQTRNTLKGMLKQKWGNGKWIGITAMRVNPRIFSLYHFIPFLFVLVAIISFCFLIASFFPTVSWAYALPFYIGLGCYIVLDVILSIKSCKNYHINNAFIALFTLFPALHFTYGLGTIYGIIIAPGIKIDKRICLLTENN